MTNLTSDEPILGADQPATTPVIETATREAHLPGGLNVRRALPVRERRMVGAWCFLDHFGPAALQAADTGLRVGPHPHTGLQTVTWLLDGEILHRDSLGNEQLVRPGQLNLMTAGHGIAHSEETPAPHGASLHGLQFWLALPRAQERIAPAFEHHATLPRRAVDGLDLLLFAGEGFGMASPARVHSPLVGAEARMTTGGSHALPLAPEFEHAILIVDGEITAAGHVMSPGRLYYLGIGRDRLRIDAARAARFVLIGGAPFRESVILWWNFVAHSVQDIRQAREDWQNRAERFGEVRGFDGPRLDAPELGRIRPA